MFTYSKLSKNIIIKKIVKKMEIKLNKSFIILIVS